MNTNHRISDENVDRIAGEFFRAQIPNPWPAAPQPWAARANVATPSNRQAARSRWALAASVAVLAGGCWYLSGHLTDGRKPVDTNFNGSADLKHVKDIGKGAKTGQ